MAGDPYQGSGKIWQPVAWSAERETRGASTTASPRCTERSCPVRYGSGTDRPCPDHAAGETAMPVRYAALGQPAGDDEPDEPAWPVRTTQLARMAGVAAETVHGYLDRGLLGCVPRDKHGSRMFGPDHLAAVRRILALKADGLRLDEIGTRMNAAGSADGA